MRHGQDGLAGLRQLMFQQWPERVQRFDLCLLLGCLRQSGVAEDSEVLRVPLLIELQRLIEGGILHQLEPDVDRAQVAGPRAHIVVVLPDDGIHVFPRAVEGAEQLVALRAGHIALAEVLEQRLAMH